jgi:putative hemolysin
VLLQRKYLEEKMKKILLFAIVLVMLTACSKQKAETGMPNPAATYCTQNGYEHKILTSEDGSQSGVCIFPDGSTCDEWAYLRGECDRAAVEAASEASGGGPGGNSSSGENASGGYMAPGTTEEIEDWWGVIKSTEPGAQYDDYFERQDLGQVIYFGIESLDPAVKAQIKDLRDSGKIVHLYGTLLSNVPDYNGSQVQVDRIEVEG